MYFIDDTRLYLWEGDNKIVQIQSLHINNCFCRNTEPLLSIVNKTGCILAYLFFQIESDVLLQKDIRYSLRLGLWMFIGVLRARRRHIFRVFKNNWCRGIFQLNFRIIKRCYLIFVRFVIWFDLDFW